MGFMSEKLRGNYGAHTLEVRGENHVLSGLVYKLFVDSVEIAHTSNVLKLPTHRTIDARVVLGGTERHMVVEVTQRMLRTEYELTIDGEKVGLALVND